MNSWRRFTDYLGFQLFPLLVKSQSTEFLVLHLLTFNKFVTQDFAGAGKIRRLKLYIGLSSVFFWRQHCRRALVSRIMGRIPKCLACCHDFRIPDCEPILTGEIEVKPLIV